MNANDVKELKQHYETQLKEKLSDIFKINVAQVSANWDINQTLVRIDLSTNDRVTYFTFNYVDNNLIIDSCCYQFIADGNSIIGTAAGSTTIDLITIQLIRDTIEQIVNSAINEDSCDAAEGESKNVDR